MVVFALLNKRFVEVLHPLQFSLLKFSVSPFQKHWLNCNKHMGLKKQTLYLPQNNFVQLREKNVGKFPNMQTATQKDLVHFVLYHEHRRFFFSAILLLNVTTAYIEPFVQHKCDFEDSFQGGSLNQSDSTSLDFFFFFFFFSVGESSTAMRSKRTTS